MLKTKQEIFDHVYKALKEQGFEQSVQDPDTGDCMYFSPEGLRCAAGHLMDQEAFEQAEEFLGDTLEFHGIVEVAHNVKVSHFPGEVFKFDPYDGLIVSFIRKLQDAHDNGFTPEKMEINLSKVVEDEDLTLPE